MSDNKKSENVLVTLVKKSVGLGNEQSGCCGSAPQSTSSQAAPSSCCAPSVKPESGCGCSGTAGSPSN